MTEPQQAGSDLGKALAEIRESEARLRRSEAYLSEAQKLSRTGSFGWNVSSGELIWSAETFCILEYDPAIQPTLELVFNRVHPEDRALVQTTLECAKRDGADFDFEHRLLMPDGSVKHVHVMVQAARTGEGAVEFVGAVMDITERKQAAEALRASEHLARGQLEALADTLMFGPKEIRVELRDNGRGFDPASRHDGFGLLGIGERVEGMGGRITIESAAGKGTALLIVVPIVLPPATIPSSQA